MLTAEEAVERYRQNAAALSVSDSPLVATVTADLAELLMLTRDFGVEAFTRHSRRHRGWQWFAWMSNQFAQAYWNLYSWAVGRRYFVETVQDGSVTWVFNPPDDMMREAHPYAHRR
jgi:hypothetical protein